jgi:ATP-dependent protease ClpP protease subunit
MENFLIRNRAELDTTEIDIFGDIGESWFGEDSVTFQNVKAQLQEINTSKIKMNVSSLGGDVNDALVIYNLLKTHPAKVEANIMGFTASSGTIIAMGADEVIMDESAMFLVHNAWTGVIGNQHDLREVADNLEQIDNKLIQIYKDKTSKRKDTIGNLMKEERWLDADEAKSFGFIDSTYKPMKAAASIKKDIELINGFKDLPNIDNNMSTLKEEFASFKDEILNDIKAVFKGANKEISNEELQAKVDDIVNNKTESYEAKIAELETEISNKSTEVDSKVAELEAKEVELNEVKNSLGEIETKLAAYEVDPVPATPQEEPSPQASKKELTPSEQVLADILNSASELDKLNAKK